MPAKIRLQRHGKKGRPFYHIVVADARAPRDGRFIERLGSYNPNTNPATIDIQLDKSVQWLQNGAQPTDTCRAILSYKGVMMRKHLQDGVAKGAITQEVADQRFAEWMTARDAKVQAKVDGLKASGEQARKAALQAESKVNSEREAALLRKRSELAAAVGDAKLELQVTMGEVKTTLHHLNNLQEWVFWKRRMITQRAFLAVKNNA